MNRRGIDVVFGLTLVAIGAAGVLVWLNGGDEGLDVASIAVLAGMTAMGAVGRLIVRRTGNPIGWIFAVMALGAGLFFITSEYLINALVIGNDLPGTTAAAVAYNLTGAVQAAPLPLVFLLFPTGAPATPRWRWVVRLWVVGAGLTLLWSLLRPNELWGDPRAEASVPNPLGVAGPGVRALLVVGGGCLLLTGILGIVSLTLRFRRARGEERQQLRWLAFVAVLGLADLLLGFALNVVFGENGPAWVTTVNDWGWIVLLMLVAVGIPAAVTIAILKYRLYEIDVVINKTIVFGALALFITLVYVAIVVGVGQLIGATGANPLLSIGATAVVSLAFQPARSRVQRFANRVVYGKRATPYEVLAQFSERVGGTYATEDVLPRTAHVIAEGTGAERAEIWLHVGDRLRRAAAWPVSDGVPPLPMPDGALPEIPDVDRTAPVRHRDELLGAIAVAKPRGESLAPAETKLLDDLAGQAGLVLSNVRLTADLEARLEEISRRAAELRASRQRIVAAQDEERRRLERNIHDGAQQHLVALAVKLRLAKDLLSKDAERARTMLGELREEVDEASDTLNALSLGIYPPLLEEQGIGPALAAQYQRAKLPVRFHTDGTRRYPIETEAAVYFCVLEALQNASKYAGAPSIEVRFAEQDGALTFEVHDDGAGFDVGTTQGGTGLQGMRDRLSVLGGDVWIGSEPGRGTTVRGRVPLPEREVLR